MNTHLFRTMAVLVLVVSQVGSSGAITYADTDAAPTGKTEVALANLTSPEGLASINDTAISAGWSHTCALTAGGGVKCWGANGSGQLGDGTATDRNTPVDVSGLSSGVVALAAGGSHTCALTAGGGVKCWGNNMIGQLGDGTTTNRYTPTDVSGLSSGVVALAAGNSHTCALTAGGGIKCWGNNSDGQLGDGTSTHRATPVDVGSLSSGVTALTAGDYHTCVVTAGGGAKCWGYNYWGQLGDGTATDRNTPVDVSGLSSGVAAMVAGGAHTCTLTATGGVKCWGNNGYGQLGDGTTTDRLTPVNVSGLASGVAALAAGGSHTCALMLGGGAKCWGYNDYGQLGDGTTTDRYTPTDVSSLASGVAALAADGCHTCALMVGGGAKCWGANWGGQLGDGTTTNRLTPVNVFLPAYCYLPLIVRNEYYCPVFYDDFSNPGSGWPAGENAYVRSEYLNGEYRVFTKQAGYVYLFRAPTGDRENYRVEVDARWYGSPGNSYGLLFGLTGGFSRYYLFAMNTDFQAFQVYRREPSGFIQIVPATTSPAIKTGTASNHLKVTRNGSQFTLEVNGTVLGTWYDSAISGLTGVGLAVSPYNDRPSADARFDNFQLAVYGSCTSAATADQDTTGGPAQAPEDDAFAEPAPEDWYWQLQRNED